MHIERRKHARDESVVEAGVQAYLQAKLGWADPDNPTPEEDVAAKKAKLDAMIAAADIMVSHNDIP